MLSQYEAGQAVPALENRPSIPKKYAWHYTCFEELCFDRQFVAGGMGPAIPRPLATGQIHTYYTAFELAKFGVDFADFYDGIREIDLKWLEIATTKPKTADPPAGKGSKTSAAIPKYKRPK